MKNDFWWIKDNGYTKISQLGYYNTREWKNLRKLKLAENPLCEMCSTNNVLTPATLVDHIEPITTENLQLFLDYSNLQSLCETCHRLKTRNSKYCRLKEGAELKALFESE